MRFPAKITSSCVWVSIPIDWVILHWYPCDADGRSMVGGRCRVTWLPNFLGWIDLLTHSALLARGHTRKRTYTQIHTSTVVQGGEEGRGGRCEWNPFPEFLICCSVRNDFTFSGKLFIFLTRWSIFYWWWRCWGRVTTPTMVTILAATLDFTENWKSGLNREKWQFFVLYMINNT